MMHNHTKEDTDGNRLTKSWPKREKGSLIAANPSPSPLINDHLLKTRFIQEPQNIHFGCVICTFIKDYSVCVIMCEIGTR